MAASLAACGETENGQISGNRDGKAGTGQPQTGQEDIGKSESGQSDVDNQNSTASTQTNSSDSSIRIAYFTWADNT